MALPTASSEPMVGRPRKLGPPEGFAGQALYYVKLHPWCTAGEAVKALARTGTTSQQVHNAFRDLFRRGLVVRARIYGTPFYRFALPSAPIADNTVAKRRVGPNGCREINHCVPICNLYIEEKTTFPSERIARQAKKKHKRRPGEVRLSGSTEIVYKAKGAMNTTKDQSITEQPGRIDDELDVLKRIVKGAPRFTRLEYKIMFCRRLANTLQGDCGQMLEEIADDMEQLSDWISK